MPVPAPQPNTDLDPDFLEQLLDTIIETIQAGADDTDRARAARRHAARLALLALRPADPFQAMLAAQAIAAHYAIMDAFRRAMQPDLAPAMAARLRANAATLARMMQATLRTLRQHQTTAPDQDAVRHSPPPTARPPAKAGPGQPRTVPAHPAAPAVGPARADTVPAVIRTPEDLAMETWRTDFGYRDDASPGRHNRAPHPDRAHGSTKQAAGATAPITAPARRSDRRANRPSGRQPATAPCPPAAAPPTHRPGLAARGSPAAWRSRCARPLARRQTAAKASSIAAGTSGLARADCLPRSHFPRSRHRMHAQTLRARESRYQPGRVDYRHLPVLHMRRVRPQDAHRVSRGRPQRQQIQPARSQPRIGDVLRRHRADARPHMRAPRRHRRG